MLEALIAYLLVLFVIGVGVTMALFSVVMIVIGILSPFIFMYLVWLGCTTLYRHRYGDEGVQHKQD